MSNKTMPSSRARSILCSYSHGVEVADASVFAAIDALNGSGESELALKMLDERRKYEERVASWKKSGAWQA